jgi:hypothetical protein
MICHARVGPGRAAANQHHEPYRPGVFGGAKNASFHGFNIFIRSSIDPFFM